ncbi:hypothetical protein [Flavobacterium sp.]|uniref:hypothetical protein n=1 Tax=Flavobacterium sp. TaxID=239 RepID=UPI0031DD32D2
MKKKEITDEDISQLLNEYLGMEYWEFQLGVGLQYEYVESNIKFSAPASASVSLANSKVIKKYNK